MLTEEQLYDKAVALLSKLFEYIPWRFSLVIGKPVKDCVDTVIVEDGLYHNIWNERACKWKDDTTADDEQAVYWVLENVIDRIAWHYNTRNRIRYTDARRVVFPEMQRLFEIIGMPYCQMAYKDIENRLKKEPYFDDNICIIELVEDWEIATDQLRRMSSGAEYSVECNGHIDSLNNWAFRDEHGGMRDFMGSFSRMRNAVNQIIQELSRKDDITDGMQSVMQRLINYEQVAKRIN